MRTLADAEVLLSKPRHGTAETAVASNWRLIHDLAPTAKLVTIRRQANEVIESLMRLPVPFDRDALAQAVIAADRKLDQIEARLPTMSVKFGDLAREETCKAIFEHCLPYKHDHKRWKMLDKINIQIDVPSLMRKMSDASVDLAALAAAAKLRTNANMTAKRALVWQR